MRFSNVIHRDLTYHIILPYISAIYKPIVIKIQLPIRYKLTFHFYY